MLHKAKSDRRHWAVPLGTPMADAGVELVDGGKGIGLVASRSSFKDAPPGWRSATQAGLSMRSTGCCWSRTFHSSPCLTCPGEYRTLAPEKEMRHGLCHDSV